MLFTHKKVVNTYTVCQRNLLPYIQDADFVLGNSLVGAVKLTKNVDPDKYKYSGYGTGCDACGSFSLSNGRGFVKDVIIFGTDMVLSPLVHFDNKKNDTLIVGKSTTNSLYDTLLTVEKEYSLNFTEQQKKYFFKFAL